MVKLIARHRVNYQNVKTKKVELAKPGETFEIADGPAAVLIAGHSADLAPGESLPDPKAAEAHQEAVTEAQATGQAEGRAAQLAATKQAAAALNAAAAVSPVVSDASTILP
jgi:hypothetical protein